MEDEELLDIIANAEYHLNQAKNELSKIVKDKLNIKSKIKRKWIKMYAIKYILDKGQPRREEIFEKFVTLEERDIRKRQLEKEAKESLGVLNIIEEFQI